MKHGKVFSPAYIHKAIASLVGLDPSLTLPLHAFDSITDLRLSPEALMWPLALPKLCSSIVPNFACGGIQNYLIKRLRFRQVKV